jgi:hypothetical protein
VSLAVTRATVRWAYRLVLGREPESEATIANWLAANDFAALREGMLGSAEFAAHAAQGFAARGGWIHGPVTEEAAAMLLALRDGEAPSAASLAAARAAAPDLPALRRLLLDAPEITRRLPPRRAARPRALHLAGQAFTVEAPPDHPEMAGFPGFAPRHTAALAALLPGGGAGAVLMDAAAGIGLGLLGLAAGAPAHAALLAYEENLSDAACLATQIGANGLARARAVALAFPGPEAALHAAGLERLDALRLGSAATAEALADWAPFLAARGCLVFARLDLAARLGAPGPDPRATLHAWRLLFPHMTGFTAAHEPFAVTDEAGVSRVLLGALARPERAEEVLLSGAPLA